MENKGKRQEKDQFESESSKLVPPKPDPQLAGLSAS
jgi:hypothetical protein